MMKKLYLLAAAALTLAACTDEAYLGENKEFTNTDKVIGFNMSTPAMSRADITGEKAADKLGKAFFVDAIKNESKSGNIGTIVQGNANDVMDNYKVTYTENSAMKTTSNTEGWEYVGNKFDAKEKANVTPNNYGTGSDAEPQTIKYWDWGAADYTFTAISALGDDISNGYVKIVKNRTADNSDAYKNGYTLTITKDATFSNIYIADRVNIVKPSTTDPTNLPTTDPKRTDHNVYGGQVAFKFRSLGTQVRAAMYETVPGYTVTVNKMYGSDDDESEEAFMASCPNTTISEDDDAKMEATVTYIAPTNVDPDPNKDVINHPTVEFDGDIDENTTLTLGGNIFAKTSGVQNPLKTSAATPTYDEVDTNGNPVYHFVLPQETNTTDMKVKVDYTLKCDATGEVIEVVGATATVPAEYLQWKPNFSYTYLFKISDNTNGHTDPGTNPVGPEGLYPITFDAVVVDAGDGLAEYITTVSDPSITTFGAKWDATNSKYLNYVADAKAYEVGTDIFATVMKKTGTAPEGITTTGTAVGNVNVYSITCSDANYVTEAAVAEYLAENAAGNITGTPKLTAKPYYTGVSFVEKVPAEDGTEITANALKMAGAAAGTYAVEYIVAAATGNPFTTGTTLAENTKLDGYYTKADTYTICGTGATAVPGVTYYSDNTGTAVSPAPAAGADVSTYYILTTTYTKCAADDKVAAEHAQGQTGAITYYKQNTSYEPAKAQYKVVVVKAASN